MNFYAAPMEGVTGYVYRNAHFHHYKGVERYYTPFLTPKKKRGMSSREKNDILPEHNTGVPVIPQIMTCKSEDFIALTNRLYDTGYRDVNLNLGCPSGTVVAKGKGCGFLARPDDLDRFFEEVFEGLNNSELSKMKVSVKTRLGVEDEKEILHLMEIYNRYPISEIIVHARILKDYYREPVRLDAFGQALELSNIPVCYNGDLFNQEDIRQFHNTFPSVDRVMIGRGMLQNPQIFEDEQAMDWERLKHFLDELCDQYEIVMDGDRNALFKLKELWNSLIVSIPDCGNLPKKIKKAKTLSEYRIYVNQIFNELI